MRNRGKHQGSKRPGKQSGKPSKFRLLIKEVEWGVEISDYLYGFEYENNRRKTVEDHAVASSQVLGSLLSMSI